jgi:hypothetical protein
VNAALSALKGANDIIGIMRASTISLDKAEINFKLSELMNTVSEARMKLADVQMQLAAGIDPKQVRAQHQLLHHFVAQSEWSDAAVLDRVRDWVFPRLSGKLYWIVDDTRGLCPSRQSSDLNATSPTRFRRCDGRSPGPSPDVLTAARAVEGGRILRDLRHSKTSSLLKNSGRAFYRRSSMFRTSTTKNTI